MGFADRADAGRRLAAALGHLARQDVVVLGLPRGGVPVAAEVAAALRAPLDVILVRKLGVPGHEELAMGAIGEDAVRVLNDDVVGSLGLSDEQVASVEAAERVELERRAGRYRSEAAVDIRDRTVVIVDDGVATGSTAIAALRVAAARGAARTVLAAPVAPHGIDRRLGSHADEVVVLKTPRRFSAVGQFYDDFGQTSDDEVVACLARLDRRT